MQGDVLRKAISVAVSAVLVSLAYYGSYLPLRKSQLFIDAIQNIRSAKSVQEFKDRFSAPLDASSPVGQEELVRNFGNFALATVQQIQDPEITKALLAYAESYYRPIIARGRGMSFNQDLYVVGAFNSIAFFHTRDPKYLAAAQRSFESSRKLGPKRPQALFGLFDVYRMENNISAARAVGGQIIKQWPTEARTKEALSKLTEQ